MLNALNALTPGQSAIVAMSMVLVTVIVLAWWGDRKPRHAPRTRG